MNPRSLGRQLYSSSVITSAFTPTLAAGSLDLTTAPSQRIVNLGDARGFLLEVIGTASNNQTLDVDVYGALRVAGNYDDQPTDYEVFHWGTINATLGSNTCSGSLLTAAGTSYRYADTITWTASSFCTAWETAYGLGTTASYSPADNSIGYLIVPNFPAQGIILNITLGTATGGNAVFSFQA